VWGRSFAGAALAVLLPLAFAAANAAEPDSGPLGWAGPPWANAKLPFVPTLTTDNDAGVCAKFQSIAEGTFRSKLLRFAPNVRAWNAPILFSPERNSGEYTRYPTDWDETQLSITQQDLGAGHKQVLLLIDQGTPSSSLFGSNRKFALLRLEDVTQIADLTSGGDLWGAIAHSQAAFPLLSGEAPSVFEFNHRVFVFDGAPPLDDLPSAKLYQIGPVGPLELACEVTLQPNPKESLAPLEKTPVAELFSILEEMAGGEGACGGTMMPATYLARTAALIRARVALRPWTLRDDGEYAPYDTREGIDESLADWDLRSLWNHRLYRRYQELVPAAKQALQTYYRDAFALPPEAAEAEAVWVVDQIIRRHFVFGNNSPPPDDPRAPLRRLLLAGADWEKIATAARHALR
jgi:hypothetical protein